MSIYRIGRGDPRSHAHNARRALIVRRHRELLERELRDLERELEERAAVQPGRRATRWSRCDWRPEHSSDDRPTGPRCGAPATHRIVWLDGSDRYSHGCSAHLKLDAEAPPHRIERLEEP